MGFVDDKVVLEHIYLRVLLLPPPVLFHHCSIVIQCDINPVPDNVIK